MPSPLRGRRAGAPPPGGTAVVAPPPPATNCTITFGHNTPDRLVCMLLSAPATQLIFSPEDAEDVARKLLHYAKAARGEVVT
jgi:hypothetical protein